MTPLLSSGSMSTVASTLTSAAIAYNTTIQSSASTFVGILPKLTNVTTALVQPVTNSSLIHQHVNEYDSNAVGSNGKIVVLGYPEVSEPIIPPSPDPNFTGSTGPIIIKTEEVVIVGMVLLLWIGAICLFFNRWGKIRMLEPYQPKFHEEEHRPSCPLVEISNSGMGQPRTSLVRCTPNPCFEQPALHGSTVAGAATCGSVGGAGSSVTSSLMTTPGGSGRRASIRVRQNSVFVANVTKRAEQSNTRKTRSAVDINSTDCLESTASTSSAAVRTSTRPLHRTVTNSAEERRCSYACHSGVTLPARDRRSCSLYPPINERRLSCIGECRPYRGGNRLLCGGTQGVASNCRSGGHNFYGDSMSPYYYRGCLTSMSGGSRRTSCVLADRQSYRENKPSFNNVIQQVTADRRPSSNMLRVTNV